MITNTNFTLIICMAPFLVCGACSTTQPKPLIEKPAPATLRAPWKPIPKEVLPFVKPGTVAHSLVEGDINNDGKQDYLLALERTDSPLHERELVLLVRQPDGHLGVAGSNTSILPCDLNQGQAGGIELKALGDGFSMDATFGSGMLVSAKRLEFRYLAKKRDWVLIQFEDYAGDGSVNPPQNSSEIQRPLEHGSVTLFSAFNGADYNLECST